MMQISRLVIFVLSWEKTALKMELLKWIGQRGPTMGPSRIQIGLFDPSPIHRRRETLNSINLHR